jgi:accessory gene regulator B
LEKVASYLTKYIFSKGVANKELFEVYQFGFISFMEITLSIIVSLIIAIWMDMMSECLLFFLIFIPLRSFAGGLHLKKYMNCLILSCFTFVFILITVKCVTLAGTYSCIGSMIFLVIIRLLYPVEHINRPIDNEEKAVFKKKLIIIISVDLFISIFLFVMRWNKLAILETVTLAIIAITMVIGKLMYSIEVKNKQI